MSNNFFNWIDADKLSTSNMPSYTDFIGAANDRALGFFGGQGADSSYVNAGLRQANLVVKALMDSLIPNNTSLNFRSNSDAVKNAINNAMTLYQHTCLVRVTDTIESFPYEGYLPSFTIISRSSEPLTEMSFTFNEITRLVGFRPYFFMARESGLTETTIKQCVLTGYGSDYPTYRSLNGYWTNNGETWYSLRVRVYITDTVTSFKLGE